MPESRAGQPGAGTIPADKVGPSTFAAFGAPPREPYGEDLDEFLHGEERKVRASDSRNAEPELSDGEASALTETGSSIEPSEASEGTEASPEPETETSPIDRDALTVQRTSQPTTLPADLNTLVFGQAFGDHMLEIDWDIKHGWSAPAIQPLANLTLHPATSALHYAVQCFEGAKVFKDKAGRLRSFRLDQNVARLSRSMARSGMPALTAADQTALVDLIHSLVRVDKNFVPAKDGFSLYLRPTAISTTPTLGVAPPSNVKLYVITSPVGPYYASGFKPVSLLASEKYTRAFPGGTGAYKMGANYGTGIQPYAECLDEGYSQILWLLPRADGDYLMTEVGTMNLFVYWEAADGAMELVTAPLDDLVLPGVTRDSILSLARDSSQSGGMRVAEREYTWSEFRTALDEGRVKEVFGSGTAAVVTSVSSITFKGETLDIPVDPDDPEAGLGPLARFFHDEIVGIQRGRIPSPWSAVIP